MEINIGGYKTVAYINGAKFEINDGKIKINGKRIPQELLRGHISSGVSLQGKGGKVYIGDNEILVKGKHIIVNGIVLDEHERKLKAKLKSSKNTKKSATMTNASDREKLIKQLHKSTRIGKELLNLMTLQQLNTTALLDPNDYVISLMRDSVNLMRKNRDNWAKNKLIRGICYGVIGLTIGATTCLLPIGTGFFMELAAAALFLTNSAMCIAKGSHYLKIENQKSQEKLQDIFDEHFAPKLDSMHRQRSSEVSNRHKPSLETQNVKEEKNSTRTSYPSWLQPNEKKKDEFYIPQIDDEKEIDD